MQVRTRNYMKGPSLLRDATRSPWYCLYHSRCRQSFIATTSLDPDSFDHLLKYFSRFYVVKFGVGQPGRPPRLPHKHAALGMVLTFYCSPSEYKTLCKVFATTPATTSRILEKAEAALNQVLKVIKDARIVWPTKEQQLYWGNLSSLKESVLRGIFAFADGKNLHVQEPSDADLQNAQFNGIYRPIAIPIPY